MDERAVADHLDRFLDELAMGPAKDSAAVDPEVAQMARRYRALGRSPAPVGARDRVWAHLATQASTNDEPPAVPFASNGRHATLDLLPLPTDGLDPTHRWGLSHLATAAVLLLALAVGYLVTKPGLPFDEDRITIPAAVAPAATPSPVPFTERSLVLSTLPDGVLPGGEAIEAGFGHYTVPAGVSESWTSTADGRRPALRFTYVLEGVYTIRSSGTVLLLKAGANGSWETVAPDTEIELGPGDASITSTDAVGEGANLGSESVELLAAVLSDGTVSVGTNPSETAPAGWLAHDGRTGGFRLPPGPVTLELRQVALAPRSWFISSSSGIFQAWLAHTEPEADTPAPVRVGWASGGAFNVGDETAILYVLTLASVDPGR